MQKRASLLVVGGLTMFGGVMLGGCSDAASAQDESESSEAEAAEASDGEATGTDATSDEGSTDSGETDGPPAGGPADLPSPTGACPDFSAGMLTFDPAGVDARQATVWMSDAAHSMYGPLVFYWHGTGSSPQEAVYGLSQAVIDEITSQGGIVVAPSSSPNSGQFPWFLIGGFGVDDDMVVADEIVACAIEQVGIDTRHIHSTGMSAGGLQTTQFAGRRSDYIASVASYSGGSFVSVMTQDPDNKFAAMIVHGGDSDVFGGSTNFKETSTNWFNQLVGNAQFAFMCDHGGGHTIPAGLGDDIWRFFQDHAYGTDPSPYESGLPGTFPSWCVLP